MLIKNAFVQHALDTRFESVDLDELHHEPVRRVQPRELLRLRIAVHVQLADLLGVREYGLELAEEDLRADLLVEVLDLHRDLLGLKPLHRLDEDFYRRS